MKMSDNYAQANPDQAWFWSENWLKSEKQAQADLFEGNVVIFQSVIEALEALDRVETIVEIVEARKPLSNLKGERNLNSLK
jgi:hypothetical protein